MQEERLGAEAAMRMDRRKDIRTAGDRLGAKDSLSDELPHVLYNPRKYRSDRGVSRLEAVRDDGMAPITGTFSGGDLCFGERVEL